MFDFRRVCLTKSGSHDQMCFPPNLVIYIYLFIFEFIWCWQFFSKFGLNSLQQLVCPDKKSDHGIMSKPQCLVFVDVVCHFLGVHCEPGPMSSRLSGASDGRLPRGPKVRTAISSKVSFRIKEAGRHNRIATMIDGWWFNCYSSVSVKLVDDPHDRCLFDALSKAD